MIKVYMASLGLKPGAAGWLVQTNPLSYGGTPIVSMLQLDSYENQTQIVVALDHLTSGTFHSYTR